MRNARTVCWRPRKADVIIQSNVENLRTDGGTHANGKFWSESEILSTRSTNNQPLKMMTPKVKEDENLLLPLCSTQAFCGLSDGHTQRKCDLYPVHKFKYLFLLKSLSDNAGAMFYIQSGQL